MSDVKYKKTCLLKKIENIKIRVIYNIIIFFFLINYYNLSRKEFIIFIYLT